MRKLVTIEQIKEVKSIPGADKIEAARVREWWVVVKKGEFKVNDLCMYFEIDSFLPVIPEYEFLLRGSSPKKMLVDGKEVSGIRLKTIKLKGQVSQGLALPIPAGNSAVEVGTDITEQLGVLKYEPPIPAGLSGLAKGMFPGFIPKTDEERIQNMADILTGYYATEKLDGTSVTYFKKDGIFGACSRNLELQEGDTTQWRIAKELGLPDKLPDNFAIQGELIGEGIQGNPLKIKGQQVFFFNVYNIAARIYLNYQDFIGFCSSLGLSTVPIVSDSFSIPASVSELLKIAEGKSLLNPDSEREGIVVRPKIEMQYKGSRLSFKAINNKYLLDYEL